MIGCVWLGGGILWKVSRCSLPSLYPCSASVPLAWCLDEIRCQDLPRVVGKEAGQ